MGKQDRAKLAIMQCRRHGSTVIAIDRGGSATIIAGSKCCGAFETEKSLSMSERDIRDAVRELSQLANEAKGAKP